MVAGDALDEFQDAFQEIDNGFLGILPREVLRGVDHHIADGEEVGEGGHGGDTQQDEVLPPIDDIVAVDGEVGPDGNHNASDCMPNEKVVQLHNVIEAVLIHVVECAQGLCSPHVLVSAQPGVQVDQRHGQKQERDDLYQPRHLSHLSHEEARVLFIHSFLI